MQEVCGILPPLSPLLSPLFKENTLLSPLSSLLFQIISINFFPFFFGFS